MARKIVEKPQGYRTRSLGAMRLLIILAVLVIVPTTFAADVSSRTNSDAMLREKLFQRFLAEMNGSGIITNRDSSFTNTMRRIFDASIVHPSFGLRWDEVPGPTLIGSNAALAVQTFVATNGWNMETNGSRIVDGSDHLKPIRGLPWEAIKDREFWAVTHQGVLYVLLKGWHHNLSGVAYNPNTNIFARTITGFQPIGQHWYAWAQPEDSITLTQKYEGQKP